jgi:hypothetical protein
MAPPFCRIIAVFLLLTGAADFLRFDSSDPSASMSAADSTAQQAHPNSTGHRYSAPARAHAPSLPDDGCIFCGTAIPTTPILMVFEPLISEFRMNSTLVRYELSSDHQHPPPKHFLS